MTVDEQRLGKRLFQDDISVSPPFKRPARIGSSASMITIADDDFSTASPPSLSEPSTDLHSNISQWKRQLDDKCQEAEGLEKSLEKAKKEAECAFKIAVSLQNAHDAMEREMADLRRMQQENDSDKVDLMAQELKSLHQELQRLRVELETLRNENATRKARIADLERQLSDAGNKESNMDRSCNYTGFGRRTNKAAAVKNEVIYADKSGFPNVRPQHIYHRIFYQVWLQVYQDKSGFPDIELCTGDGGNLLDYDTLERVVNTLALFAKKSVLLFGGHHSILEDKLVVWGYEWPTEGSHVPMEFIPSVDCRDSWSDPCRTLRCRVNACVRLVDAEFTCPDPNEVFRVYYQEPTLNADDSMQRLYAYMVTVFMKPETCSLPMTVYVFATVAMVLARDKAHFSSFVSRGFDCKSCAALLMHLSLCFWAEDPLHGTAVHRTTPARPVTVKQEVFGVDKEGFSMPDNIGLETASKADANNRVTKLEQCTASTPTSTPPPASQQNERLLPNGRPHSGATDRAGDDRFDETGRYRMHRFERQGMGVGQHDENAALTKDPSKIWTIAVPSDYTTPDLGMNRVLDALADRMPRRIKYEDFVLMFKDVSQQFSPKRFLSSLASKRDAAMLLECFKVSYELTEESFASFLYCKIVISRTENL